MAELVAGGLACFRSVGARPAVAAKGSPLWHGLPTMSLGPTAGRPPPGLGQGDLRSDSVGAAVRVAHILSPDNAPNLRTRSNRPLLTIPPPRLSGRGPSSR